MSHVEVLATGIKLNPSNKGPFGGRSRDQELLQINRPKTHGCNFTFDPSKTKHSRASEGNDQAIFADRKA